MKKLDVYSLVKCVRDITDKCDEKGQYNSIKHIISTDDRMERNVRSLIREVQDQIKGYKEKKIRIKSSQLDRLHQLERVLEYYACIQPDKNEFAISIIFKNGTVWNVERSASVRSDRMTGLEERLHKFASDKSFIIIGDYGRPQKGKALKRAKAYRGSNTSLVSREEFIDELLWEVFRYKNGVEIPDKNKNSVINGQRGLVWEKIFAYTLSNDGQNREILPDVYELIEKKISSDEGGKKIRILDADKIPGKGKDDIWIKYEVDKSQKTVGVSIKTSSRDEVSVHQDSAEGFIRGLGIKEKEIAKLIRKFEEVGSAAKFTAREKEKLKAYFSKGSRKQKFIKWAFTRDAAYEIKYILLHSYKGDPDDYSCHSKIEGLEEYLNKVEKIGKEKTFGTKLTWTRKDGKMQLKMPFLYY